MMQHPQHQSKVKEEAKVPDLACEEPGALPPLCYLFYCVTRISDRSQRRRIRGWDQCFSSWAS
jgi:hypothetical protein